MKQCLKAFAYGTANVEECEAAAFPGCATSPSSAASPGCADTCYIQAFSVPTAWLDSSSLSLSLWLVPHFAYSDLGGVCTERCVHVSRQRPRAVTSSLTAQTRMVAVFLGPEGYGSWGFGEHTDLSQWLWEGCPIAG